MKQPRMLEHFPAIDEIDPEAARALLFEVYGADRAEIRKAQGSVLLHANHLQMKEMAVSYCEYGSASRVEFPEASYVRQIFKIAGNAQASADDKVFDISQQQWTALIPAETRFGLATTPDYQQLVLRLEMDALRRSAQALVGDSSDRELIFEDSVDFESLAAQSLRRRIFFFAGEFDLIGGYFSQLAAAELERTVIVNFLFCHRHTFSRHFMQEPADTTASSVRRVEEYIEANWDKALDVETLASVANVSARSVFRQFKSSRGYSPLTFVKKIRLQKARTLLLGTDRKATVTSIALRCGFQNVGHFASDYRLEFGELPSDTLAKARRS